SILKLEKLENLDQELKTLKEAYDKVGQTSLFNNSMEIMDRWNIDEDFQKLEKLIEQQGAMTEKFDVVVTNPPYMGGKGYTEALKKYVEKNYKDSKADLFAVFMEQCSNLTKKDRYTSMITMHSWMFLSSFETLRKKMIETRTVETLVHLGARAFEEIGGEVVQTVAWISKNKNPVKKGNYIRLVDYNNAEWKEKEFFEEKNNFQANQKDFEKIPGSPIAYWVSDRVKEIFEKSEKLGEVGEGKQGLATADNDRFLRMWSEVDIKKSKMDCQNKDEALESGKKWFPYNKGGEKRKWYGNQEYFVNWENDGNEIRNFFDAKGKLRSRPQNTEFYFRESISWSDITSSGNSFRVFPKGFIYDVTGMSYFINNKEEELFLLGILNNKLISELTKIINPTLHLQIGDFIKLPYLKI
ncbi:MAG: Eco57I restriction-modification methylase domain-containing protein, partial [Fusobacteriaceae bacterium]